MPAVRTEKNRLWTAIVPPSIPRPFTSSQPVSLSPSDRHSTSLRLLFQDTERLLQDFSKKHEQLLVGMTNALKGMANLDEALAASRTETVAEIKNLVNMQHLSVRDQLNDIGSAVTNMSDGCGKIKARLDHVDEFVGLQIKDAIEVLHKRLDDMGDVSFTCMLVTWE
ncbi:hypothetical protein CALVIDRAFT_595388 [Calocera viscosa TUFC12733]|uniref:Uncharacterized protein n=1 Tax=Calocera viscosa (strain TUFC12733) TaxID=1330018 RepID=A0A167R6J1_CALVF|nr:hypothetical protein CALVIDRAFT_595388 [Calocera viscosa TUFC12733]